MGMASSAPKIDLRYNRMPEDNIPLSCPRDFYPAGQRRAKEDQLGVSLDEELKNAGMLSVAEILAGRPIDAFIRNAGVTDIDTFAQWLDMRCEEMLSMQARMQLDKNEESELYEWVMSHAAVLQEVLINFKAATRKT